MAIHAVSNNNVSFGHIKTTKKGNEYRKTHAATRTGLAIGLLGASVAAYQMKKTFNAPDIKRMIAEKVVGLRNHLMSAFPSATKAQAGKLAKLGSKAVFAAPAVFILLGNLAIGASVNKIINHRRAKAVDKQAEAISAALNAGNKAE